ncbi:hypothetical protein WBG78_00950 [Chryseolinea sp. T2]|uniref:hypothetical protein n=1 Tax=Chryseolinea sp. T2 TaxID=3129255 RepID=UPI0030772C06
MNGKVLIAAILVACVAYNASAQDRSLGLRLGYPLGITFKSYIQSNHAVEFLLGTQPGNWSSNYYKKSFHKFNDFENDTYLSHHVRSTLYLQGRYLFQYNIPVSGMEGMLDWYWGAGAMIKFASVQYQYHTNEPPKTPYYQTVTDVDFGPEFMGGMEYTFEDVPITLFGEVSVLIELVNRPFVFRGFAGVGGRLRF